MNLQRGVGSLVPLAAACCELLVAGFLLNLHLPVDIAFLHLPLLLLSLLAVLIESNRFTHVSLEELGFVLPPFLNDKADGGPGLALVLCPIREVFQRPSGSAVKALKTSVDSHQPVSRLG